MIPINSRKKTIVCLSSLVVTSLLVGCSGSSSESGLPDSSGSSSESENVTDAGTSDSATDNPSETDAGTTGAANTTASNDICTPSTRLLATSEKPFLGNIFRPETPTDERFHQLWNQVTPENATKWNAIESTRDVMDWSALDDANTFAQNYNYSFKFHTLIAGDNEPDWISVLNDADQLIELTQWFDEVAARYPEPAQIDVVSEPISSIPSYSDALGGEGATGWDWVIRAFELARTRFPNSELILNDYKVAQSDTSGAQFLELASLLKQRNLIDAIGIEGHFLEDTDAATIKTRLDLVAELALPLYLADLDINISNDADQLDKIKTLVPAFYEHPAVNGLTFWGYRENQLWRSDAFLLSQLETDRPALDWLECYAGLGN